MQAVGKEESSTALPSRLMKYISGVVSAGGNLMQPRSTSASQKIKP